ncbi:uncharacterized protein ARB_04349 [Trichophyton benhamiae CBS 112371]|uniref:Uncharacterized protein n=2 Tax=Trichophyton TaxID=5550 RepID=D4AJA0_ARTBC|nr:uncharacterized protein ARB_04349 [Trichophyton benhamiae CBS 112371]XP_003022674.1 uncharacterized protein TRV_03195 [Trichophyton verrucosum HKI 0517]EFE36823.1 hypothetical protein ARB_04349 [Trichophyton benhamiae CBS 112371]EFE42056.1 hypothetical protein TRV_03195 [Trichophyton verrucosum HKI 0517]
MGHTLGEGYEAKANRSQQTGNVLPNCCCFWLTGAPDLEQEAGSQKAVETAADLGGDIWAEEEEEDEEEEKKTSRLR